MEHEQDSLDKHDDNVENLSVRLQSLICKSNGFALLPQMFVRRLQHENYIDWKAVLWLTKEALDTMPGSYNDLSLVEQFTKQLANNKKELASIYKELVSLDLEEDTLHTNLEKFHFGCCHRARKLHSYLSSNPTITDGKEVILPKLEVLPPLTVMFYTGCLGSSSQCLFITEVTYPTLRN